VAGAKKRLRSPAVCWRSSRARRRCDPVRAPQQERGQRRVEQILDAAESVFTESGVDATSMQAIADRAESSVGSLYHFFPNKDAIVLAVGIASPSAFASATPTRCRSSRWMRRFPNSSIASSGPMRAS
jgi:hypothetical protein